MNRHAWIGEIVTAGLKRLGAMGLRYCPPVESRRTTLEVWLDAVEDHMGNAIEKIDGPRLMAGFKHLERNCTDWPKPKELFEAMPPRPSREALCEPPPNAAEIAKGKEMIRKIMERIG